MAGVAVEAPAQVRGTADRAGAPGHRLAVDPCPAPPGTTQRASRDATPDSARITLPRDTAGADPDTRPIGIALLASASAASVTFAKQPEVRVRLCGGIDSVRVVERRNLPERIVPGQTYRDVFIAVEILGRVDAACLAERIGVAPQPSAAVADSARARDCAGIAVGTGSGTSGRSP